jgi:hypothetical protein
MSANLESSVAMFASVRLRNTGNHYNMGGKGWQELYRADQEPRLTMMKGNTVARGGGFTEWRVDGIACPVDEIVERLRVPPAVTPEELAALRDVITDEPMRVRSDMFDGEVRYWLREKGLIEYTGTPGWFRRSESGRAAVAGDL